MRSPQVTPQYRPHPQQAAAPAILQKLASMAAVSFNGNEPWDIQVHNPETYRRILSQGSLGFGEAYMEGMWDAGRLDQLFHRLLSGDVDEKIRVISRSQFIASALRYHLSNLQSIGRAFQVGKRHYDIGNDVFEAMLDPGMNYSCAYWVGAKDLAQAQRNKLDLVCRKLDLRKGEHLLDIGCGWGGMAQYAAVEYGVKVTGITVSQEQLKLAQERCQGLSVDFQLLDYRSLEGRYDKIVSIGMFEHVGPKNYAIFFDKVDQLLEPHGLFLLHTIGDYRTSGHLEPWIDRYIFPNGHLPSARELAAVLDGRFIIEDWHNFGFDYDRTLMAWWDNFNAAWPQLKYRYDQRFYRMWKYYLLSCAGMFRARKGQLWQLVLNRRQGPGNYRSVR